MNFDGVRDAMQSGNGRRVTLMRKLGDTSAPAVSKRTLRVGKGTKARKGKEKEAFTKKLDQIRLGMGVSSPRLPSLSKVTSEELQEMEAEANYQRELMKRRTMISEGFRVNGRVSGLRVVANPQVAPESFEPTPMWQLSEWLDERVGVVNPMGNFRLTWDMMTSYLLMVCLFLTPFQLCFIRRELGPFELIEILNLAIDLIFLMDFLLTFNTAILENGELVTSRKRIASNYLKGWAWIDLVTAIPTAHILHAFQMSTSAASSTRLTRFVRIMKFSRLLKMFKLLKFFDSMNQWDDDPGRQILTDSLHFLNIILIVFFLSHFSACAFAFVADGGKGDGWRSSTWVAHFFNEGYDLRKGDSVEHFYDTTGNATTIASATARHTRRTFPTPMRLYIVALYWAFSTLTTVGYGDIAPVNNAEMLLTVLVQFAGTCVLGYVMADVAAMISREDMSSRLIKEKIEAINAYMKHRHLPAPLKQQIRNHFSYMWQRSSIWDEREILLELPAFLRSDVVLFNNSSVIEEVTLLADLPQSIIARLCLHFEPSQVSPNSKIIVEGEMGNDFFIVASGKCSSTLGIPTVIADSLDIEPELLFRSFEKGDFFAEYTLFTPNSAKHPYTVRATGPIELLMMSHETFVGESTKEPLVRERFQLLAEKQYQDTMELFASRKNLWGVKRRPATVVTRKRPATSSSREKSGPVSLSAMHYTSAKERLEYQRLAQEEREEAARENMRLAENETGLKLSKITTRTLLQCKMWAKRTILKLQHDAARQAIFVKEQQEKAKAVRSKRRTMAIRRTMALVKAAPGGSYTPVVAPIAELADDEVEDLEETKVERNAVDDALALVEEIALPPDQRARGRADDDSSDGDESETELSQSGRAAAAKTVDAKGLKSIEARLEHRLDKLEANIIEKLAKRLDMTICKSMLKMKDQQLLRGRGF